QSCVSRRRLADGLPGRALERAYEHREIGGALARAHQRVDLLLDDRACRQRQARLLRELEHDAEILVIKPRIDPAAEIAAHHALAEELEHAARRHAAHQRLVHASGIEPAAARERQRLCGGLPCSNTCGLPPAMMDSVAPCAPAGPPDTGASICSMPRAANACAMRRVA